MKKKLESHRDMVIQMDTVNTMDRTEDGQKEMRTRKTFIRKIIKRNF